MKLICAATMFLMAVHAPPVQAQAPAAAATTPCAPGTERGVALPQRLEALRAWVKANPKHLCAVDARALLESREAKIRFFAAQPSAGAQPAKFTRRPTIDPDGWVGQAQQGGSMLVRLSVEADGKVEDCKIIESAAGMEREHGICRKFMLMSRLLPARDARGLPIASSVDQRISWTAGD